MLLGKTIITTAVGAEGLGLTHEEQVLIADDKDLFRAALHRCFDNPELSKKIGEQARCFVLQHYRRSEIYRLFSDYLTVRLTHA